MARPLREPVTAYQIAAMQPGLRRYAQARHVDSDRIDDLVQETIARLLEVRERLDLETTFAYGLAVLTNLDRSSRRGDDIALRHRHRLIDLDAPVNAEDVVVHQEQIRALHQALDGLPPAMRDVLMDRYDADDDTTLTGAHTARLARARARLRLEYLLTLRRVTISERRCRSVLTAISARDVRRQTELGAGRHVAHCSMCMSLAEPLARRESRLFGLWPLFGLFVVLRGKVSAHPVASTGAALLAVGGVATAIVVAAESAPLPHHDASSNATTVGQLSSPPPSPSDASPRQELCQLSGPGGRRLLGRHIAVHNVVVTKVPSDEGFLVSTCRDHMVWVRLQGHGESPAHVQVRDHVTIAGTVRRVRRTPGSLSPRAAASLQRAGVELVVPYDQIHTHVGS